jgi:hypothetical protein
MNDEYEMIFKTKNGYEEIKYFIGTRGGAWKKAKNVVAENKGWEITSVSWAEV